MFPATLIWHFPELTKHIPVIRTLHWFFPQPRIPFHLLFIWLTLSHASAPSLKATFLEKILLLYLIYTTSPSFHSSAMSYLCLNKMCYCILSFINKTVSLMYFTTCFISFSLDCKIFGAETMSVLYSIVAPVSSKVCNWTPSTLSKMPVHFDEKWWANEPDSCQMHSIHLADPISRIWQCCSIFPSWSPFSLDFCNIMHYWYSYFLEHLTVICSSLPP